MTDHHLVTSPLFVASEMLALVHARLLDCGAEAFNRVHVAAGLVAWDDCCGMLVCGPERVFRTGSFPAEGPDQNGCFDGLIAVDLVVLLVRCVPVLDDRGNAPTAEALEAAYSTILWEAGVVWNAVSEEMPHEWESANVSQTYVGAEGGCIGVETRITVGLDQETWCSDCPEIIPG